ncbi:hypothetical protein SERLADRAFT_416241 [Serpula lacrymans var. lacrymans S7.9]|uniref:Cullin family profile domain-containing protein n=1 Tax=Serpula lacrymans var. lacrymans (strain S7.9) TaxID=578457 RepID=F8NZG4_SERL9|nr:uncharacterized protein SERLADRAFT_416241 [Serpula lacrymans var. lacrymans S7.9]EGO23984.1 hypothetical protein SERLADRAFT_416241 [Serpula lacrymans var. lacrymans S7.9]
MASSALQRSMAMPDAKADFATAWAFLKEGLDEIISLGFQASNYAKYMSMYSVLALVQWKTHFLIPQHRKLVGTLIHLSRDEREGLKVDTSSIKTITDSLASVYKELFETPFLDATEIYYTSIANAISKVCNVSEYLKWLEDRLRDEGDRVDRMVETMTCSAPTLFFSKGLECVRDTFERRLKKAFVSALSEGATGGSLDSKKFVDTLLDVRQKNMEVITNKFGGEAGFMAILDKACSDVVNGNTAIGVSSSKSSEMLVQYADDLERASKDFEKAPTREITTRLLVLFRYVEDKSHVHASYERMLSQNIVDLDASEPTPRSNTNPRDVDQSITVYGRPTDVSHPSAVKSDISRAQKAAQSSNSSFGAALFRRCPSQLDYLIEVQDENRDFWLVSCLVYYDAIMRRIGISIAAAPQGLNESAGGGGGGVREEVSAHKGSTCVYISCQSYLVDQVTNTPLRPQLELFEIHTSIMSTKKLPNETEVAGQAGVGRQAPMASSASRKNVGNVRERNPSPTSSGNPTPPCPPNPSLSLALPFAVRRERQAGADSRPPAPAPLHAPARALHAHGAARRGGGAALEEAEAGLKGLKGFFRHPAAVAVSEHYGDGRAGRRAVV